MVTGVVPFPPPRYVPPFLWRIPGRVQHSHFSIFVTIVGTQAGEVRLRFSFFCAVRYCKRLRQVLMCGNTSRGSIFIGRKYPWLDVAFSSIATEKETAVHAYIPSIVCFHDFILDQSETSHQSRRKMGFCLSGSRLTHASPRPLCGSGRNNGWQLIIK